MQCVLGVYSLCYRFSMVLVAARQTAPIHAYGAANMPSMTSNSQWRQSYTIHGWHIQRGVDTSLLVDMCFCLFAYSPKPKMASTLSSLKTNPCRVPSRSCRPLIIDRFLGHGGRHTPSCLCLTFTCHWLGILLSRDWERPQAGFCLSFKVVIRVALLMVMSGSIGIVWSTSYECLAGYVRGVSRRSEGAAHV